MKNKIFIFLMFLSLISQAQKITALPTSTVTLTADYLPIVKDPFGTAVTKKTSIADFFNMPGETVDWNFGNLNLTSSASFKFVDGNQGLGKVLTSSALGVATWQTPASTSTLTSTYIGYGNGSNNLTGSTALTYSAGIVSLTANQNSGVYPVMLNANAGNAAQASIFFGNGTYGAACKLYGTGMATVNHQVPNRFSLETDASGGIVVASTAAAQLSLWTNNVQRIGISSAGVITMGSTTYPTTITSGYIPYATASNTLSSSGELSYDGAGTFSVTKSMDGSATLKVLNSNAGTSAASFVELSNGTTSGYLGYYGTGYVSSPPHLANAFIMKTAGSGGLSLSSTHASGTILFHTGSSEIQRMLITSVGNIHIGASTANRASTVGTNVLNIFNGTAPVGTLANGCSFYSTTGEMRVMDAAGNATLISPHEKGTNNWIYYSVNTTNGKVLKIDMEKMMKKLNDTFGWDFVHEFTTETTK